MFGLTPLGTFHTAISLLAVSAGIIAFCRDREISPKTLTGKFYIVTTIVVCATGFGIFQHGGFGKPHVLGVLTLLALATAAAARRTNVFGKAFRPVEITCYTTTFFFHLIPGLVETTTRLPVGNPLIADREGPELQAATATVFLLLVVTVAWQLRRLRAAHRRAEDGAGMLVHTKPG